MFMHVWYENIMDTKLDNTGVKTFFHIEGGNMHALL